MKAFIIGSGTLGATTAFLFAEHNLFDEIVMFDTFEPIALNHSLDLSQAVSLDSPCRVHTGPLEDMKDADLVVMAAGLRGQNGVPDFAADVITMSPLISSIAEALKSAPNALVITMTNPVDALSYTLCRLSGLPSKQFLGFNWNDSLRFRWSIGRYLGIDPSRVDAYMLGEHGRSKLSVWSDIHIDGEARRFSESEQKEIAKVQDDFWSEFMTVTHLRTAGWSTAYGCLQMVLYTRGMKKGWCPCSVIEGNQVFGRPAYLDENGIAGLRPIAPDEKEQALLDASVAVIRGMLDRIAEATGWNL